MKKDRVMRWDIITLAEDVQARQVPGVEFFKKHFTGNCYDLFYDRNGNQKPAKVRNWSTTITTTAVDKEGNKHTMELEFTPDHKTKLTELTTGINGSGPGSLQAGTPMQTRLINQPHPQNQSFSKHRGSGICSKTKQSGM